MPIDPGGGHMLFIAAVSGAAVDVDADAADHGADYAAIDADAAAMVQLISSS